MLDSRNLNKSLDIGVQKREKKYASVGKDILRQPNDLS